MRANSNVATGSIRESYQDCILIEPALCLAVVADGQGPEGLARAENSAGFILNRIREIAAVTGAEENEYRIKEAIQMSAAEHGGPDSHPDLCVVWINRGLLTAVAHGRCTIHLKNSREVDWQKIEDLAITQPVIVGQKILLCTEGLNKILENPSIKIAMAADEACSDKFLTNLSSKADAVYDGDDRSLVMLDIESSDLKAGELKEIELFVHFDREFKFPLWAPLAAAGGLAASSLLVAHRLHKWWRDKG